MSIAVNWSDPSQSAITLTIGRGWTWDDLKQAIQQADTMITNVDHTVHLIVDLRDAGGLPRDFLSASGEIFAQGEARPNEGQRIIVGAGMLVQAAYRSLSALYGAQLADRPLVFAANLEEAQRMVLAAP